MNRNQAKELLPIIKAFSEGKDVEYFDEGSDKWRTCELPQFDYNVKYRIKPEIKYRPFKDAEECWQEMLKHQPFGWVKDKKDGRYTLITSIYNDTKEVYIDGISGLSLYAFSSYYTFVDGTPFGILEEE